MTTRNVQKLIKKYADKVRETHDLPESVSPHTFRRTRGTGLYRDGVDLAAISVLLGHADMKTTRDHYTTPSKSSLVIP
ncbi:MAG: tyrosine-type recombinase/integrase [Blautia sp.]|nr:tyrosine-type recombinase/integrase [Blautia sp.]